MDEKELWAKFCQGGKIHDYLEYRNCVNNALKTELDNSDKNKCTGACNTGAEYR